MAKYLLYLSVYLLQCLHCRYITCNKNLECLFEWEIFKFVYIFNIFYDCCCITKLLHSDFLFKVDFQMYKCS